MNTDASTGAPARLLATPGEPAGIGPDILLQWAAGQAQTGDSVVIAVADPGLLDSRNRLLGLNTRLQVIDSPEGAFEAPADRLCVLPCKLRTGCVSGRPDPRNAAYVLDCLKLAADACLAGTADAMVTGPVHKSVINDAGISFSGHTEFLAGHCALSAGDHGAIEPVMMLATPGLRVALVTTHLPLRKVAGHITPDKLQHCLEVLDQALRQDFGIERPHILVTGLNPHAGEDGHLGDEEIEIIRPVLAACTEKGMHLTGPLPADTLFTPRWLDQADAVLAMYHDQGLPVLKHMGFGQAVNITLGLPIIRTSVDHGTALDLAGTGRADPGSFACAIQVAADLVQQRRGSMQGRVA